MEEFKKRVFDKYKQHAIGFIVDYYVDLPYKTEFGCGVNRVEGSFEIYFSLETTSLLNANPDNLGDFTNAVDIEPMVKREIQNKFGWNVEGDSYKNNSVFVELNKSEGHLYPWSDYLVPFEEAGTYRWGYKWSLKSRKDIYIY